MVGTIAWCIATANNNLFCKSVLLVRVVVYSTMHQVYSMRLV